MNYYYHPFLGPVFPTYLPPAAPQRAPGEARVGNQTAEFTVSNDRTKTRFTGTVNVPEGVIMGTLSDFAHTQRLPATVSFKPHDLMNIQMKRINERDWVLVDQNGNSTGYQFKDYTVMHTAGGTHQVITGTFIDPAGNKAEFFVKTDPVAPVVIIAGICATALVVAYGIHEAKKYCEETTKLMVENCLKNKLVPVISFTFNFAFDYKVFKMGIYPVCEVTCKPIA
jgi:hypothetical protein